MIQKNVDKLIEKYEEKLGWTNLQLESVLFQNEALKALMYIQSGYYKMFLKELRDIQQGSDFKNKPV